MLNRLKPFSSTGYSCRERRFAIGDVRKLKDAVYILTDIKPFLDTVADHPRLRSCE